MRVKCDRCDSMTEQIQALTRELEQVKKAAAGELEMDDYNHMVDEIRSLKEAFELKSEAYRLLHEAAEQFKSERDLLREALEIMANNFYEGHAKSDAWITIAREALKASNHKSTEEK